MNIKPFDKTISLTHKREIKSRWYDTAGATVKNGDTEATTTTIEFSVYHSKDRKAFVATLTPLEIGEFMVRWTSSDPGVRIATVPVARYSEKALNEFYQTALAALIANADLPQIAGLLDRLNIRQEEAA